MNFDPQSKKPYRSSSSNTGLPSVNTIRGLRWLVIQTILKQLEDQNGPVNVGYQMTLHNESGWPMLELVGVDQT